MEGESEFLQIPEDEYDALNDETFGNDDGAEYNWEESQTLFGELSTTNGTGQNHRLGGGEEIFDNEDFGLEGERTRDVEYDEFENENSLEESISRLVMDEFDDDYEDVSNERLQRIAAGKSNYPYFMPPQVVNRHLQLFMDKDLPGGSSILGLGSSVWSMHPTSIAATSTVPVVASRSTVSASSTSVITKNDPTKMIPHLPQAPPPPGLEINSSATNLSNLLGVSQKPAILPTSTIGAPPPPGLGTKPPTFKTVDEIEEELLRDVRDAEIKKALENKEQQQQQQNLETVRPKIMSVEELERQLIQGSSVTSSPAQTIAQTHPVGTIVPGQFEQQQQQLQQHLDPTKIQSGTTRSTTQQLQQQQQQQQQQIRFPINNNTNNINQNASNMLLLRQGVPLRNVLPPQPYPHPNNFNNIMASQAAITQAALQQLRQQQQQQQLRYLQMNSHPASHIQAFRMGFPMAPNNLRNNMQFPLGPRMHQQHQQNVIQPRRHDVKTDPYSCLMTEKDKQRLRNIQIVQLQNDHPYVTDYYCLMRRVKIAGPTNPQKEILRMLFPKKTDDENGNKKQYEPAHFENSLGKLQAQSAVAPKKSIDTVIRVTETAPSGNRKSYRYLLMEIEKLYEAVLSIEEADIRTSLGTADENDALERKNLRAKMEKVLLNPQKLAEIMVVKKGRFLICRLAPLMDQTVRATAIQFLIKTFPSWTNLNGDSMDLYTYIRYCIINADVTGFERLCLGFSETVLQSLVISKLGMSLVMCMLHQGEKLIATPNHVPEQFQQLWTRCVYAIWMTILKNKSNLAQPVEIYNIYMHRQLLGDPHKINPQLKEEMRILLSLFLAKGAHLNKAED